MVKRLAILALLGLSAAASASESGTLAARAQRSINAGKFAKAYNQLERALLASRKEADLLSEGRILLAMAQIRTQSLDLDFADSLISIVRPEVLDRTTAVNLTRAQAALANARGNYADAAKLCSKADPDTVKKTDNGTIASFYAECAISYAGARKSDEAQEALKMVGKKSSKKGGFYAFTAAQIADLEGHSGEADSLYRVAEAKSIEGNKPYTTATILYKRSQLKSTKADEAEDLKLRCKNAFELMGLPNNSKRCAE
ncbi:MAG: hypothetical protein IKX42_09105 [Fibrobacter sp.]|nr:hypothetical protein [Fibrobacter sp.]